MRVHCALPLKTLSLSVGLALAFSAAHAATLEAYSSYTLNNGTPVTQSAFSTATVDLFDTVGGWGGYGGESSAFLHTYGSAGGNFGSRTTGYGVYDVTGLFRLTDTITNTAGSTQRATFSFYITPGALQSFVQSTLTGDEYLSSSISFNVKADGNTIWSSSAQLLTTGTGTTFTQSGANIYAQTAATRYSVGGMVMSLDLGTLEAGQSLSLSYEIVANANGVSTPSDYIEPITEVSIPAQTIFHPEATYEGIVYDGVEGGAWPGDGWDGWFCPVADVAVEGDGVSYGCGLTGGRLETITVPAWTQVIPATTFTTGGGSYTGYVSGSEASSGDPFSVVFGPDGNPLPRPAGMFQLSVSAVPEPQTWALMLAGLIGIAVMVSRRTAPRA